jgi:hypothetical protein
MNADAAQEEDEVMKDDGSEMVDHVRASYPPKPTGDHLGRRCIQQRRQRLLMSGTSSDPKF